MKRTAEVVELLKRYSHPTDDAKRKAVAGIQDPLQCRQPNKQRPLSHLKPGPTEFFTCEFHFNRYQTYLLLDISPCSREFSRLSH
jgi:hypothetical protein